MENPAPIVTPAPEVIPLPPVAPSPPPPIPVLIETQSSVIPYVIIAGVVIVAGFILHKISKGKTVSVK